MTNLRIGRVPGVTLTKWERIWRERFPRVPLEVVDVGVEEQRRVLAEGIVDMCFVRLPIERDGLHAIPLYSEVPVAWLSKDHPLAELEELTSADLADDNLIRDADPASVELATYSAAVLLVPLSVARSRSRRDLVHRPVTDAPPTTVALVWRVDADNQLLDEFIGVVRGRTVNSSRTEKARADAKRRLGRENTTSRRRSRRRSQ